MGISDYACVIVGRKNQQQTIYNHFQNIHSSHKNLPLGKLKEFYNKEETIYDHYDEEYSDYEYNVILIVREYAYGGEKPNHTSIFEFDNKRLNWINFCGSCAEEWDFYLSEKDEELAINYTCFTPSRILREKLNYNSKYSEERALKLEKLLNITIPKKEDYNFLLNKKEYPNYLYCVSIHPQAFRYIIYQDSGCDPMMLIDICENKNIPSNFREKWLKMNYEDALKDIQWYFSYIRDYFVKSNKLQTIYEDFKKSNKDLFDGYLKL